MRGAWVPEKSCRCGKSMRTRARGPRRCAGGRDSRCAQLAPGAWRATARATPSCVSASLARNLFDDAGPNEERAAAAGRLARSHRSARYLLAARIEECRKKLQGTRLTLALDARAIARGRRARRALAVRLGISLTVTQKLHARAQGPFTTAWRKKQCGLKKSDETMVSEATSDSGTRGPQGRLVRNEGTGGSDDGGTARAEPNLSSGE